MSNPDELPPAQQRALRILAGRVRGSVQSQTWQALERRGLVRWYNDNGDKWELTPDGRDTASRLPADRDELIRVLFEVYRTWWYDGGGTEPPADLISQGVASLLSNEDHEAMQDACALVEPYEGRIREVLGEQDGGDTRG